MTFMVSIKFPGIACELNVVFFPVYPLTSHGSKDKLAVTKINKIPMLTADIHLAQSAHVLGVVVSVFNRWTLFLKL